MAPRRSLSIAWLPLLALALTAAAHEHHDQVSEEQANAPVDTILWIHIFLQIIVWGILFPTGMVLGLSRSRWHVPLQSVGFVLTAGGYILGHSHGGRAFLAGAHGKMANILLVPIALQLALGIYLKLHIHEQSIRPWAVRAHGLVGKCYPILGWTQMLFGAIAFRGYCRGGHLGQCIAHYIMGSSFIAYATIMAILFLVGEGWVRRSGRSPEWWDSWIIMIWGIVNTFTEHLGGAWSVKDMQHTMLGVLWWAGGFLGVILARNNQRTVIPAVIFIITGWAFAAHEQALMFSTHVHTIFGFTLGMTGITRIIEVCFIVPKFTPESSTAAEDNNSEHTLADGSHSTTPSWQSVKSFLHLPPFLLTAAGVLFISATDEETRFAHGQGMDHATYILIMFSFAFLIYSLIVALVGLYAASGRNATSASSNGNIELTPANKWYARVPANDAAEESHVIGDDD